MKNFFVTSAFVLFALLLFSSDSGAEEEFTISLNPGWHSLVDGECETITTNNGTYENCAKVLQFETKLSGYNDSGSPSEWAIDGDMHAFTGDNNIRYTDVYSVLGAPLGSSFTFSLNGANFSDNTTYSFSYSLRTSNVYSSIDHRPYWRNEPNSDAFHTNLGYDYLRVRITPNLILDTSSVLFSGNSSQELNFNLTGQIGSTDNGPFDTNILLNSTNSPLWGPQTVYLNDCTRMYAEVILTKNASTDSEEILAHYVSTDFTPEEYSRNLCSLSTSTDYSYDEGFYMGDLLLLSSGIFLAFVLALLYFQAKLTSWLFRGTYSNNFTQFLAIFSSVILFIFFAFFAPVFCLAVLILFAQIVAYYTGHYEKPEIPADSEEGAFVDTKNSTVVILQILAILIGTIFILIGLSTMMICSMSLPPQCGTLMDAAPFFSVSIICFILFFYIGRKEKSKIDDKPEVSEEDQPKPK